LLILLLLIFFPKVGPPKTCWCWHLLILLCSYFLGFVDVYTDKIVKVWKFVVVGGNLLIFSVLITLKLLLTSTRFGNLANLLMLSFVDDTMFLFSRFCWCLPQLIS
jgi:hypothetical protein